MRVNGFKSTNTILNTGVPQGCVSSVLLIYTNEITCSSYRLKLFKYGDDMALVPNLTDHSLSTYKQCQHNGTLVQEKLTGAYHQAQGNVLQ